jgi:RND family efflux transporter MFP subunit
MPDVPDSIETPSGPKPILLDRPEEEKLREEVRDLRGQLEQERKKNERAETKPISRGKLWFWLILGALLIVVIFLIGFIPHFYHERELNEETAEKQKMLPVLTYLQVNRSAANTGIELPGTMQGITEAPILARADGYVKRRYADIGDRVREGQLLAEIEAPDLDQQVSQGQAQLEQLRATLRQNESNLKQGQANQGLAQVTAQRYAGLLKKGAVSRQENDQNQTNFQAQTANVGALEQAISAAQENIRAGEANLRRLRYLQSYLKVRAPFTGVITLRNIDTGSLISTGNTLLYRVAQTDRLRTYIYVPETNAPSVQTGQTATLYLAEYPGRRFRGTITRTSSSLDPTTRTLLTEVQVANPDGTLFPGTFAQVSLNSKRADPPVLIPGDALLVRSDGTFVGVLENEEAPKRKPAKGDSPQKDGAGSGSQDSQGGGKKEGGSDSKADPKKEFQQEKDQQEELPTFMVHLVRVNVGRDYGNEIEVVSGLNGGEKVISNPNDSVQENGKVKGIKSNTPPGEQKQAPGGGNLNQNTQKAAPRPGGEPTSKQPTKEKENRGPGA